MRPENIRRIVCGVDGSEAADAALAFAAAEAARDGAKLVVVMAWTWLDQRHLVPDIAFEPDYHEEDARAAAEQIVRRVLGDDPGDVEIRTVMDRPATALLQAADEADLVVVGSRGLGGFKGLLLGSVSRQVVDHAPCSVLVHRDRELV